LSGLNPGDIMATEARQHGVKGVFLGGDWMPIEDCTKSVEQLQSSDKCDHECATCPRSRSRKSAAKPDGSYDVVIIGAGCIGGAIARELSKYTSSVLLLEAADDVTQGATKGNSGIVHAGFDDKPGSVRAKFCWPGNQMFPKLDEELHFGYQRNGSLVLARGPEEEKVLEELMDRGRKNGVKRLKILKRDEVFAMEPYVNEEVTAALYAPDAGNLIPYEYAIALCENAVDNGVELRIRYLLLCFVNNSLRYLRAPQTPCGYLITVVLTLPCVCSFQT
jgi:glycerol-3-phosphate dehydrogenase